MSDPVGIMHVTRKGQNLCEILPVAETMKILLLSLKDNSCGGSITNTFKGCIYQDQDIF